MKKIITKIKSILGKKENVDYLPQDLAVIVANSPEVSRFLAKQNLAKNGKINPNDVVAAMRNFISHYGAYRVPRLASYFEADGACLPAWVSVFKDYNTNGTKIDPAFFRNRNKASLRYVTVALLDQACFHHGSKMIPLHSQTLAETLLM